LKPPAKPPLLAASVDDAQARKKALKPRQESRIYRLVVGRCPDQLKMPFALWTREAVGQLIAHRTGVKLSLTAIGTCLAAWGLTPQKPIRRATERDEVAMKRWLRHDYPAIRPSQRRAQLRARGRNAGGLATGEAFHTIDDLQRDQLGQVTLHDL
jgi:transposase